MGKMRFPLRNRMRSTAIQAERIENAVVEVSAQR
jgi:hypothetical protein